MIRKIANTYASWEINLWDEPQIMYLAKHDPFHLEIIRVIQLQKYLGFNFVKV